MSASARRFDFVLSGSDGLSLAGALVACAALPDGPHAVGQIDHDPQALSGIRLPRAPSNDNEPAVGTLRLLPAADRGRHQHRWRRGPGDLWW